MYTMAPEDYFRLWTAEERRRAEGWTPAPAKRADTRAASTSGRLRRLKFALRSATLHS